MNTKNLLLKRRNFSNVALINLANICSWFPFFLFTFSFFLLPASILPVKAITFVTDRTALGENDQLNWSSLGKVFNPFAPDPSAFLPNIFSTKSTGGLGINIEIPRPSSPEITPPFVFQTSFPPFGIPTNFADGDFILFTGFNPTTFPAVGNEGPITINFETPVKAAGTQIAVDDTSEFEAFISAFDNKNNLLGSFSINGTSSLALDNSAVFLGVNSDIPEISKLVFGSSIRERALGINHLSISTTPVSEPGNLVALVILGLGGLLISNKKVF
ncbi:MAG: hypothetical protein WBA93_28330 [Microcoleaceae cyanobacterium]